MKIVISPESSHYNLKCVPNDVTRILKSLYIQSAGNLKKSSLVSAGSTDICRRDTVCEQLISKNRIFRRISLPGYGDLKLSVHICTVYWLRLCQSWLTSYDAVPALSRRWLSIHIYWAVFYGMYTQYLQIDSSCQADSATAQLISKSRIFRGRSLGSAMIWRSHQEGLLYIRII